MYEMKEQIAADTGLDPRHSERWIQLFKTLGLIYEDEEEIDTINQDEVIADNDNFSISGNTKRQSLINTYF